MSRSALFRVVLCLVVLGPAVILADSDTPPESKGPPREYRRLRFRSIGPAAGGRVCRACGVPGDPSTWYAATAAGGVWKSSDAGLHWKGIFDEEAASSIGSIAVAPSDPNVLYVGTGEANIRGNVEVGHGIWKSVDAGKTWKQVWKQEGQIGTMIVHPRNPDIAVAAVLGHAFAPNPERGVYRTKDGGKTWQRVLTKDPDTGASDVCFDPSNPNILFAGLWQVRRRPWEMTSGGLGSGLYTSRDGGDTWTHLVPPPPPESAEAREEAAPGTKRCPGLPEGMWGKLGVGVAASDGRRVYALIEAEKGGFFRSDDGGETWSLANDEHALRQRAWYYTTFTIHPRNPDVVWFPQVPLLRSIDGGKTLHRVKGQHHGDHHDIWIDPKDPDRIIDSNDGGVDISVNGGETWFAPPLPVSQFYHISVDNRWPYHVAGTMQDIGTASGPSDNLSMGPLSLSEWYPVGGGEAGWTVSDPAEPDLVYAGEYGGYISRYDHRTRQTRNISIYPYNPSGHGGEDLRYRFQWTAPIFISPHDHHVVYHAANVLFRTEDGGRTWAKISDDLTRNDKSKQKWSGGPITGDNTGVEIYGTLFAIAESPLKKGLLWVGSDDGLVHVSTDGGKHWTNVTAGMKGLPEWATVICIEPSPFDADTAYVVVDAHKLDDRRPYLFKTADLGKTWQSLTGGGEGAGGAGGLPAEGSLRVVRVDPRKKGLLYLGGENGLFASWNDGGTWTPFKLNLPTVTVTDLVVKNDDLVVGTNGRSIWIFDDLTPVRSMGPVAPAKDMQFFTPRSAIRYHYHGTLERGTIMSPGENGPRGITLHYSLKKKPKKDLELTILDREGKQVNHFTSKKIPPDPGEEGDYSGEKYKILVLPDTAGLHRVVWDLRWRGADVIKGAKLDGGEPQMGPLVNPGTYTLELTADGKTERVKLEVLYDPRIVPAADLNRAFEALGTQILREDVLRHVEPEALHHDLDEQLRLALHVRDDISRLARAVEQLRSVRRQIEGRDELLASEPKGKELVEASKKLLPKLEILEEKLHNPKAKVSYDILAQKGGAQLYSQLAWLFEMLKEGDGPPTQGVREVYEEQAALLSKYLGQWGALQAGEVAELNALAKKLDLPALIIPSNPAAPPK
jgi:photosystem II stability/assembly factor-like uncharacterized protein